MVFEIRNFDDTTKWSEVTIGAGTIQNKNPVSFNAVLTATGDRAGLATPIKHHISELVDLRVLFNRNCAISAICLAFEELEDPTSTGRGMAIKRDAVYGVVVWFGGGARKQIGDPLSRETPAEIRITAAQLITGEWQISFYYNGQLLHQENLISWMGEYFYVKLGANPDTYGTVITGTTTFASAAEIPPEPLTIDVNPKSAVLAPDESVTFTATVSGGVPPYTVEWFDNVTQTSIGIGETYTFSSSSEGEFEIFARATDSWELGIPVDSVVIPITVTTTPPPKPIPTWQIALLLLGLCAGGASAYYMARRR